MDLQYSVETAVEVEVADRVCLLFALKPVQTTRSWVAPLLSRGKHVVWSSGQSCKVTPGAARWPQEQAGVWVCCSLRGRGVRSILGSTFGFVSTFPVQRPRRLNALVLSDVIQSQSNVGWVQAVKAVATLPVNWKVCIMHMVSVTSVLFIKDILVLCCYVLSRPGRTYTLNWDPEVQYIFQKVWCHFQMHRVLKYFTAGAQYQ